MRLNDFSLALDHRHDSLVLVSEKAETVITDAAEIRVTRTADGGYECEVSRPGADAPARSVAAVSPAAHPLERANGWVRSVPPPAPVVPLVTCPDVSRIASAIRDRMLDEQGDAELDRPDAEHTPTTLPRSIAAMPSTETSSPPATKSYFSSLSLDELRKLAKSADRPAAPKVAPPTAVVPPRATPPEGDAESVKAADGWSEAGRGVAAMFGCEEMLPPTGTPDARVDDSATATRSLADCFDSEPRKATATRQFRRDVGRS